MLLVLLVAVFSSNLNRTYELLVEVNSENDELICQQNRLVRFLTEIQLGDHSDIIDEICNNKADFCEGLEPNSLCKTKIVFERQILDQNNNEKQLGELTKDEIVKRRLMIPNYIGCNSSYYCPPGPCSMLEIDYQINVVDNVYSDLFKNSRIMKMVGEGRCGPTFGIQTKYSNGDLLPEEIELETAQGFPSFTETEATILHAVSWFKRSGLVPVPPSNSKNANPKWYYTDEIAWKYGAQDEGLYNTIQCEDMSAPPYGRTKDTTWYKNKDTNVITIGELDGESVGEYFKTATIKDYILNEKPMNENQTIFNTLIPQLPFDGSSIELPEPCSGLTGDEKVSCESLKRSDNSTNYLLEMETIQNERYKNTCDLTQCNYVPVYEKNSDEEVTEKLSCFFAEIIAMYVRRLPNETKRNEIEGYLHTLFPSTCFSLPNFEDDGIPFKQDKPFLEDCACWFCPEKLFIDFENSEKMDRHERKAKRENPYQQIGCPFSSTHFNSSVVPFSGRSDTNELIKIFNGAAYTLISGRFWDRNRIDCDNFFGACPATDYSNVVQHMNARIPPRFTCRSKQNVNRLSDQKDEHWRQQCLTGERTTYLSFIRCMQHWAYRSKEGNGAGIQKSSSYHRMGLFFITIMQGFVLNDTFCGLDKYTGDKWQKNPVTSTHKVREDYAYLQGSYAGGLLGTIFRCGIGDKFTDGGHCEKGGWKLDTQTDCKLPPQYLEDVDLAGFDMIYAKYDDKKEPAQKYKPLKWATDATVDAWAHRMHYNSSFANSKFVEDSAACDCAGIPPVYAVLDLPWNRLGGTFYENSLFIEQYYNDAQNSTVLTERSFGWSKVTGDFRGQLPVGLYIPSNAKHSVNFTIYERDILLPKSGQTVQNLADKYFIDEEAPNQDVLFNELRFDPKTVRNNDYFASKIEFQYGACMRWPYGQIARAEMGPNLKEKWFGEEDCDEGGDGHFCYIREKSMVGYCEQQFGKYTYCANDPFPYKKREEFCASERTRKVVIGQTVGIRAFSNVCNKDSKTCLLFQGEENHGIDEVFAYGENLENYTVLISPFNWSVASGLMNERRGFYDLGTDPKNGIKVIADDDTELTGMEALTKEEFNVLIDQSVGATKIMELFESIVQKIENSLMENGEYDLPFITETEKVTRDTLYPPFAESQIHVTYNNVTIVSAHKDFPIKFFRNDIHSDKSVHCMRFLVSGNNFKLPPPGIVADQTYCKNMAPLERTPVVFGGNDVRNASISVESQGAEIQAAFVGQYTTHFLPAKVLNADGVVVKSEFDGNVDWSIAAARTVGTLSVVAADAKRAVVQPWRAGKIRIEYENSTEVDTVNVSKYTAVFGEAVMRIEYPEFLPHNTAHTVLFGILVAANTLAIVAIADRWA